MASKKLKGQKLNLASFVGAQEDPNALPTAPSGLSFEDQRPNRGGRWDKQRADAEGGGQRGGYGRSRYGDEEGGAGEEEGPSRADEANLWRRAAPAESSRDDSRRYGGGRGGYGDRDGGDRYSRGGFDRGDREDRGDRDDSERSAPRADDATAWRRPAPSADRYDDRESRRNAPDAHTEEWRSYSRSSPRDRDVGSDRERPRFSDRERSFDDRSGGDRERPALRDRENGYGGGSRYSDRDREDDRGERGYGGRERYGGGDRFGGERGGDRYSERPHGGARSDERESAPSERPAHLRNLLKKNTDGGEPQVEVGAPQRQESALARMERQAREREAEAGSAAPTRDFNSEAPASSARAADDLKQLELAPIKLSSTRRTQQTEAKLEPARSSQTNNKVPAPAAAVPAPVAVPVVIDESRYASDILKPVASNKKQQNVLEKALGDKASTVSDKEFEVSFTSLDTAQYKNDALVSVLARSVVAGSLTLKKLSTFIQPGDEAHRSLFASVLAGIATRKSDIELQSLISASGVDVLSILAKDRSELDSVLARFNLLSLRPVPDLTNDIKAKLDTGNVSEVIDFINKEIGESVPVKADTAKLVASTVFDKIFVPKQQPDFSLVNSWAALLKRVGVDLTTKLAVAFAAQNSWNKLGAAAPKGSFKDCLAALLGAGVLCVEDFTAWREDLKDKTPGKPKALLQVGAWIKAQEEEAKKKLPKRIQTQQQREDQGDEEDEDDGDEDEDEEDEELDDPAYPRRR